MAGVALAAGHGRSLVVDDTATKVLVVPLTTANVSLLSRIVEAVLPDEDDGTIEVELWCDLAAARAADPVVLRAGGEILVESREPDLVHLFACVAQQCSDWPAVTIDGALHPVDGAPGWRLVLAVPAATQSPDPTDA